MEESQILEAEEEMTVKVMSKGKGAESHQIVVEILDTFDEWGVEESITLENPQRWDNIYINCCKQEQ